MDVVSLGKSQPALPFEKKLGRAAMLSFWKKPHGHGEPIPPYSGRGLCSWVCSGFLATSTKRDSPGELAGRLKFMLVHCTFALLQMKIINQKKTIVFMPHPSLETRWKPVGDLHMVTGFSKKVLQRRVMVKASLSRSGYWANTLQLFKTIWGKLPH